MRSEALLEAGRKWSRPDRLHLLSPYQTWEKTVNNDVTSDQDEAVLHEIRVEGHLDERWADWVEGLTFTHEADGTTTLTGPLADQAALHGVLIRMRDLGVPIVSVRRLCSEGPMHPDMEEVCDE